MRLAKRFFQLILVLCMTLYICTYYVSAATMHNDEKEESIIKVINGEERECYKKEDGNIYTTIDDVECFVICEENMLPYNEILPSSESSLIIDCSSTEVNLDKIDLYEDVANVHTEIDYYVSPTYEFTLTDFEDIEFRTDFIGPATVNIQVKAYNIYSKQWQYFKRFDYTFSFVAPYHLVFEGNSKAAYTKANFIIHSCTDWLAQNNGMKYKVRKVG